MREVIGTVGLLVGLGDTVGLRDGLGDDVGLRDGLNVAVGTVVGVDVGVDVGLGTNSAPLLIGALEGVPGGVGHAPEVNVLTPFNFPTQVLP